MLELINAHDIDSIKFYVIVRISIVLICWFFIAVCCIVDFWSGITTAKALKQPLMSHGFRRTITKIIDYYRLMLFALMLDMLGSLLPFYSIPFATGLCTIAVMLIEGKSVIENSKRKKAHVASVPEMVEEIVKACTTERGNEVFEEIINLVNMAKKYEKNK